MIHLKNSNSLTHSVFIKRRLQCGTFSNSQKFFHNVLSKLLDPQSWDLIHSAVCFIIHPFWHAFEGRHSFPPYICNQQHPQSWDQQVPINDVLFDFWFILMSGLC